jgi:Acetyltransferase (GNAT) domain
VNLIETERLLLEPLHGSRLEEFVALTADPYTMAYGRLSGPFTHVVAERRDHALRRKLRRRLARRGRDRLDAHALAWGHGYATEAGRAVRDEAFERLELDSIVAVYHPENGPSGRVMGKLGMEFERDVVN